LSGAGGEYAMLAARSSYSAAGHVAGGLLQIVQVSGRAADNVIEFRPRTPRKAEAEAAPPDLPA
jgi:hypothetical protein